MKKFCNRVGGELRAVKRGWRKPAEDFRERFRSDGAGFARRAAVKLLGQDGSAGDRRGTAAAEKTSLGNSAIRNSREKFEDVAAYGVAYFYRDRGIE